MRLILVSRYLICNIQDTLTKVILYIIYEQQWKKSSYSEHIVPVLVTTDDIWGLCKFCFYKRTVTAKIKIVIDYTLHYHIGHTVDDRPTVLMQCSNNWMFDFQVSSKHSIESLGTCRVKY